MQIPSHLWVHNFFHSLGIVLKSWYMHEETMRQTACWKVLQDQFCHDFSFSGNSSEIIVTLQQIKKMLFTNEFKSKYSPTNSKQL
jgi:hypothetical protein